MSGKPPKIAVYGPELNWGDTLFSVINPHARLYMGIRQSTNLSHSEIAELMGVTGKWLAKLVAKMSKDAHVSSIMKTGLPSAYGEWTVHSAACSSCNKQINYFPCVSCCNLPSYVPNRRKSEASPESSMPSETVPGTPSRVEAMATRVQLGFSPFCDLDAVIDEHGKLVMPSKNHSTSTVVLENAYHNSTRSPRNESRIVKRPRR